MILRILLILLPVLASPFSSFHKSHFYVVFAKGNLAEIKEEISNVQAAGIPEQDAYEGALMMRKAAMRTLPVDKLHDFKTGHGKLEEAIGRDSSNVDRKSVV